MNEPDDAAELLFFDTFSHEEDEDINLDLVQFPKPVYITQVRIIPLGARVQADFPGGVRLGATNPSKFDIEFFVNDLGMPGTSAFENLGQLEYNQNDCIHLECPQDKIPTDGLVLRGWYSTITLAVYGILTNAINEPIVSPPPPPCEPAGPEEICNVTAEVPEDALKEEWKEPLPGEISLALKATTSEYEELEYSIPSVRESHFHPGDDERESRLRKVSHSSDHSGSTRNRTHSDSNERDYLRERDRVEKRTYSRSPEYAQQHRVRHKHRADAEEQHMWPRTPPASIDSPPQRPRSPDSLAVEYVDEDSAHYKLKSRPFMRSNDSLTSTTAAATETHTPDDDDTPGTPGGEQFEPILSDDEIIGDDDDDDNDSLAAAVQAAQNECETELVAAAKAAEPAILCFDPFNVKDAVKKYAWDLHAHYRKELETLRLLCKKFEMQTKCSLTTFLDASATSVDERENFVLLGEQLVNQLAYLAQHHKKRNFLLQQFFQTDAEHHMSLAFGILQIALNFEAACTQPQPAFKIRHIKVGARLAELLLGASDDFMDYVLRVQKFAPFTVLFNLYQQEYMALSIRLMLLKAIYALLDTKAGLENFLNAKINGYQMVLEILQQTQLTRTKYALQAIVKKLNLNEALACIRENCKTIFVLPTGEDTPTASFQHISQAMTLVQDALATNALSYQQPRRFLPVSKKFEIVGDATAQRCFANTLQSYFVQHSLGESLLLLLCNVAKLPAKLLLATLDLLAELLQTHVGVDYFVDDCFETTQMIIAVLLCIDEVPATLETAGATIDVKTAKEEPKLEIALTDDTSKDTPKSDEKIVNNDATTSEAKKPIHILKGSVLHRLQKLGVALAYKVETRYHLDAIAFTATSNDYDANKLATHLHALHSLTCNTIGRRHTIEFIGVNNNLQIFMDLIKKEQRMQAQRQLTTPGAKYKSPVLSYAVDMVDCCVRHADNLNYLIEHGANILELSKNHDSFESSVAAALQEMFVYVKPLESINIFAYDDISPLVEVLTRSLEYITTFPGDLIMSLRILRYLAIGPSSKASLETEELKHRFVALQFYAADGVQMLLQILEKLCSYFEQPGLHTPALISTQGVTCCQIILPTLQVLHEMLSFAIQCRDVEFKDLTAIDHLMKAYCLLYYFPADSQCIDEVHLAKKQIIQTFLAYTQPNEQDEESLQKSLWTQMIREILKNIDAPSMFLPGLQVLAQLLPLPLPIPLSSDMQLLASQQKRLITERKLWSAHLHPQSLQIAKLIESIAPSSYPQLVDLMTRVCLQLADLAPNVTLLITKTLSDLLCNEWTNASNVPTQHLARLLQFFARLTAFASLKSSALSILSGKLWELFQSLLTLTEATDLSRKCQVSIHRILESFLDSEISLIDTLSQSAVAPELNLASALPPKELIPRIVEAILTNLLNADVTHEVSALGVRNLVILTEHNITFYHISCLLRQKCNEFQQWIEKIVSMNESGPYNSNIESLVLLLRSLTQIEDTSVEFATIPARTLKLNTAELVHLIGAETGKPLILQRIQTILQATVEETNDALLTDINKMVLQLESCTESVTTTGTMDIDNAVPANTEPLLPQTEGIVTQFAARPIFTVYETNVDEAALTAPYWLDSLCTDKAVAEDIELQYERIACDLTEIANAYLSPETNLTTDCKRLLHLSASPQSNRERTPTAPCFRTRRVEVEPSTGRPEKKIYITPVRGRGFARTPPTRGDLFRSRPPNTSRPPSLHVDDFLALETCGAQPTGPTGYNKIPPLMRGSRVGRNRGSRIASAAAYRKSKLLSSPHPYRIATAEPHFVGEPHYTTSHFVSRPRGRGGRPRPYLR